MPFVRHPIVFTGTAQTYRAVWRRNMFLLAVSLLFAWPWTQVRKLQYLYSHTYVGGHALAYHADPMKIFIGNVFSMIFIEALYYGIYRSGPYALTLLALVQIVFAALLPFMLHKTLAFRLRHTSWQGQRFHLAARPSDAWRAMCVPTFLYILAGVLLVWCVIEANAGHSALSWSYGLLSLAGFCFCLPLMYVQFNRYRQRHAAWGNLRNATPPEGQHGPSLSLSVKTGAWAFVACALLAIPATYLVQRWTGWSILSTGAAIRSEWTASLALLVLFVPGLYLGICGLMAVPYPYIGAQLQNQCLSGIECTALKVRSEVPVEALTRMSARNWLRVLLTGGSYYPQAFMAEAKLRLQSVTVGLVPELIQAELAKFGEPADASRPPEMKPTVLPQAATNLTVKP